MTVRFEHEEVEYRLSELKKSTGRERDEVLPDVLRKERERLERQTSLHHERDVQEAIESGRFLHERWMARPLDDPRSFAEVVAYEKDGLPV